ncbi:MAG: hypothetical protein SCM11_10845 [Bacillota bacterium]|nr:hypothetical protein [Bacillota bacterium]
MHRHILLSLLVFILIPLGVTLCRLRPDYQVPTQIKLGEFQNNETEVSALPTHHTMDIRVTPAPQQVCSKILDLEPVYASGAALEPMNEPLRDSFAMTASISCAIGYFAGQTNSQGQTMPVDENRYLAGEKILLVMDFNQDPGLIEVVLNSRTWRFFGVIGILHYETGIIIPDWQETLSWSGDRLAAPLTMTIRATARSDQSVVATQSFSGIEITGHVLELVQAQPVRP